MPQATGLSIGSVAAGIHRSRDHRPREPEVRDDSLIGGSARAAASLRYRARVIALRASAVLLWLIAFGFGIPAPFVASFYLRERTLPTFMGLFPMYGGPLDRFSPEVFAVFLGLFTALCALEAYAGWLLWNGEPLGAGMTLVLLPIEVVFWVGFAVPVPPLTAIVRLGLLAVGWSALR